MACQPRAGRGLAAFPRRLRYRRRLSRFVLTYRPRFVITVRPLSPVAAPLRPLPRDVRYTGQAREIAGLEDRRRATHVELKVDSEWLAVGQLHRILARADDPFERLTGAGGSPAFRLFEETEYGPQPIVFRVRDFRAAEFHRSLRTVRAASLPGELLGCCRAARVTDALPVDQQADRLDTLRRFRRECIDEMRVLRPARVERVGKRRGRVEEVEESRIHAT